MLELLSAAGRSFGVIVVIIIFTFFLTGIPPHTDTHSAFEDEIISLSLGAEVNLLFACGLLLY